MNPFEADECSCWNGLGDYTSFIDFDAPDLYWTSPAPRYCYSFIQKEEKTERRKL